MSESTAASPSMTPSASIPVSKPIQERWLLMVLAMVQFTHIMDFVIMMPLGPQFMRAFDIGTQQFGWMISAYTFSAAIFGFLGAFFIDRLDRRKALLGLYMGFSLGTLLCALAPSHVFFIFARIVAGAFGGIMNAVTFAIVGDVIPYSRRGAATGVIMSSFSVASIVGVPFGIFLANKWSWHAPFLLLAGLSAAVWWVGFFILKPMVGHLQSVGKRDTWGEMRYVLTEPAHIRAFLLSVMLMIAGFSVIPYLSAYFVSNVGLSEHELPYIYLIGGSFTLFTARGVGILADRFGKKRVFKIMAWISVIPTLLVTNLPVVPFALAIFCSTFFMITMSGRMVPAVAMITGSAEAKYRGSFMSVNASIQQMGSGLASMLAGYMIVQNADKTIGHYHWVGVVAVGATLLCIYLSRHLRVDEGRAPGASATVTATPSK